jgi:hypothetical protein
MEKERPKMPDEGLGKFCIIAGCAMVFLPLFLIRMGWEQKFPAIAGGFGALSWGLKQVIAAKKWRQEYGEPSPKELAEIKQSHSVSNLPKLLGLIVLVVALAFLGFIVYVSFFQPGYQGVQLVHPPNAQFVPNGK